MFLTADPTGGATIKKYKCGRYCCKYNNQTLFSLFWLNYG